MSWPPPRSSQETSRVRTLARTLRAPWTPLTFLSRPSSSCSASSGVPGPAASTIPVITRLSSPPERAGKRARYAGRRHDGDDARVPLPGTPPGVRRVRSWGSASAAPAGSALLAEDAPAARGAAGRTWPPGALPRPARARRLRPPDGDVRVLDDDLRRAGDRPARPPPDRAGGDRRHLAGRQRDARGGGQGARAGKGPAHRDAGARQRAARLRARLHAHARLAHVRGPDRTARLAGGGTDPARDEPPERHAARLGEPGPEAVGVGAPGPLLRAGRAAQLGAAQDAPQGARHRPSAR